MFFLVKYYFNLFTTNLHLLVITIDYRTCVITTFLLYNRLEILNYFMLIYCYLTFWLNSDVNSILNKIDFNIFC